MKKILPVAFILLVAIAALLVKRYNSQQHEKQVVQHGTEARPGNNQVKFDRRVAKLFFTKHARCRMKCRQITQSEVKKILEEGTINYSKSRLSDKRGPSYALEGITGDKQHVRIIFAPKHHHMSVVTVIDLDVEHQCDCN